MAGAWHALSYDSNGRKCQHWFLGDPQVYHSFVLFVPGCCARFSARSSLYIHSKKHLQDVGAPKSRCPVSSCNRLFTSKHSMKAHVVRQHSRRPGLLVYFSLKALQRCVCLTCVREARACPSFLPPPPSEVVWLWIKLIEHNEVLLAHKPWLPSLVLSFGLSSATFCL